MWCNRAWLRKSSAQSCLLQSEFCFRFHFESAINFSKANSKAIWIHSSAATGFPRFWLPSESPVVIVSEEPSSCASSIQRVKKEQKARSSCARTLHSSCPIIGQITGSHFASRVYVQWLKALVVSVPNVGNW